MKRANEVLAEAGIDGGLTTDRAVDLSEQSRWRLDDVDAAPQNTGGKSRQITDNAAAESDDCVAPLNAHLEKAVEQHFEVLEALGVFSGGERDRIVLES